MFNKILIANTGDQRRSRAAAQLHRFVRVAYAGDFTVMEVQHV